LFRVRHDTLRILSWWMEPIHIWIWMPNNKRNEGYVIVSSPIYPMQKKKSWSPLPNLLHRVTGNPNHTIICLGLVCMYLLSHVC
jgi:hypothetical protein